MADQPAQHLALLALLVEKGIAGAEEIRHYNERALKIRDLVVTVMEKMGTVLGILEMPPEMIRAQGLDPKKELEAGVAALNKIEETVIGTYYTAELREGLQYAEGVLNGAVAGRDVDSSLTESPTVEVYLAFVFGDPERGTAPRRRLVAPVSRDLASRIIHGFLAGGGTRERLEKETGGVRALLEDFVGWRNAPQIQPK